MRTAYSNVPRRSLYYVLVCTSATLLHVAAENTARNVWFSEPLADSLRTTDRIGIVVRYKQPETDDDALSADQMLVGQAGRKAGRRAAGTGRSGWRSRRRYDKSESDELLAAARLLQQQQQQQRRRRRRRRVSFNNSMHQHSTTR